MDREARTRAYAAARAELTARHEREGAPSSEAEWAAWLEQARASQPELDLSLGWLQAMLERIRLASDRAPWTQRL